MMESTQVSGAGRAVRCVITDRDKLRWVIKKSGARFYEHKNFIVCAGRQLMFNKAGQLTGIYDFIAIKRYSPSRKYGDSFTAIIPGGDDA